MARRKRKSDSKKRASRLELIRRRHRELILEKRELFGEGMSEDYDDPLDEVADADALQFADAVPGR
ncbi:MAG: hypothetical protein ACOC7T_00155 [Planctomycetota bacterium]